MKPKTFIETFDQPGRGWIGWDGEVGPIPIEVDDGAAVSRSPWWVDCNHAPPGAGYLHILFALHTFHGPSFPDAIRKAGGPNAYVAGGYPTDLRNARVTVHIKGDIKMRGARMCLLVQGNLSRNPDKPNWVNQILASQPIQIGKRWSEQTIRLVPDQKQWIDLGTRHDRVGFYGGGTIEELLQNVNGDIILVLFPLEIKPLAPVEGNLHLKWWDGRDGEIDRSKLPEGVVMMDEFRIEFP